MADADAVDQECVEGYLFVDRPRRYLLLRRPPDRERIWVPVSGKVEVSDRDFPAAVRREIAEETGFGDLAGLIDLDWAYAFEGPGGGRWRLHAFGAEVPAVEEPKLSREHEQFAWLELDDALERLHYSDNREALRRLESWLVPSMPAH